MSVINKYVVLIKRPMGKTKLSDFAVMESELPSIKEGEVQLKTLCFSLDPYMRARMNDIESYAECFKLNEALRGHAICRIEKSNHEDFKEGNIVLSSTGWQTYANLKPNLVHSLPASPEELFILPEDIKPSLFLGALGMPGLTAYHGLLKIGDPKPGEVVVVSSATGTVGSMVGQLAKAKGCRVVGIAGGPDKCQFAVETLGIDACIDYKSKTLAKDLQTACPDGIDVYFENVGGQVLDAVMPLMNLSGRITVCGLISWYNAFSTLGEKHFKPGQILARSKAFIHLLLGVNKLPIFMLRTLGKRLKVQGFIIQDHVDEYAVFLQEVLPLIRADQIKYKESIVEGIENAPLAFGNMLSGRNIGKTVIEI